MKVMTDVVASDFVPEQDAPPPAGQRTRTWTRIGAGVGLLSMIVTTIGLNLDDGIS